MTLSDKLTAILPKAETSDLVEIAKAIGDQVRAEHIHTHLESLLYYDTPEAELEPAATIINDLYSKLISS